MSLAHFEHDPDYGLGIYRRKVRIVEAVDAVIGTIDDTHHAMWVRIEHRGGIVRAVAGGIERGPATSCGAASGGLSGLRGLPIDAFSKDVLALLPPDRTCSHLNDLARWSLARIGQGAASFLISIPDEINAPVWIEVQRGGTVLHRWLVRDHTIVGPEPLAGLPLLRGFHGWASRRFAGSSLDAATMLQRGVWVARGRRHVVDRAIVPLHRAAGMDGVCFSYSGANRLTATNNLNYVRDFTDGVVEHPLPARATEPIGVEDGAS